MQLPQVKPEQVMQVLGQLGQLAGAASQYMSAANQASGPGNQAGWANPQPSPYGYGQLQPQQLAGSMEPYPSVSSPAYRATAPAYPAAPPAPMPVQYVPAPQATAPYGAPMGIQPGWFPMQPAARAQVAGAVLPVNAGMMVQPVSPQLIVPAPSSQYGGM